MTAAFAIAAEPVEPWRSSHAPPRVELPAFAPAELRAFVRSGEREVDRCEALLAWAARARGSIDVKIGEGLHALRQGDQLARLGCHLDDYAREVLDVGEHTARNLARLGAELPKRPPSCPGPRPTSGSRGTTPPRRSTTSSASLRGCVPGGTTSSAIAPAS